jgi:hypothetical protein
VDRPRWQLHVPQPRHCGHHAHELVLPELVSVSARVVRDVVLNLRGGHVRHFGMSGDGQHPEGLDKGASCFEPEEVALVEDL